MRSKNGRVRPEPKTIWPEPDYLALGNHSKVNHVQIKRQTATVWNRVKSALQEAGLPATQVAAARIAQVAQASVAGWNRPGTRISMPCAIAIAKATGTCVEWVVTGRGPRLLGQLAEPLWDELCSLWPRLPDAIKGRLLGIAGEHAIDPIDKRSAPEEPAPAEASRRRARKGN